MVNDQVFVSFVVINTPTARDDGSLDHPSFFVITQYIKSDNWAALTTAAVRF